MLYDDIDVYGYSLGGVIACYLQSIRKINKLVLLAPAYKYLNFKKYNNSDYSEFFPIILNFPKKKFFHLIQFTKIIAQLSSEFHSINCPLLILIGTKDYMVKEESGYLLFDMGKSSKRLVFIDKASHFSIVKDEKTIATIKQFLEIK